MKNNFYELQLLSESEINNLETGNLILDLRNKNINLTNENNDLSKELKRANKCYDIMSFSIVISFILCFFLGVAYTLFYF